MRRIKLPLEAYGKERKQTMTTITHMSTSIEGLLRNFKRKKITFIEDDNGNPMSDKEVRAELAHYQALGYKLIPRSDCKGFDPFGGGCPGHEEKDGG